MSSKELFCVYRDTSTDSDEFEDPYDTCMTAVKDNEDVFGPFYLMDKSEDKVDKEVTLLNLKENLNIYSTKKLKRLASVPIS